MTDKVDEKVSGCILGGLHLRNALIKEVADHIINIISTLVSIEEIQ